MKSEQIKSVEYAICQDDRTKLERGVLHIVE